MVGYVIEWEFVHMAGKEVHVSHLFSIILVKAADDSLVIIIVGSAWIKSDFSFHYNIRESIVGYQVAGALHSLQFSFVCIVLLNFLIQIKNNFK